MEIYKDVIGYEGIYQVSNLGNIKSLKYGKEKQMKFYKNRNGYLTLGLRINGIVETNQIHQLVAEAFLNHKRCGHKLVVNHIDFNKSNNKLDNLEIVTNRDNSNRKHLTSASKYTGVSWHKNVNKWQSNISLNGKLKHLGYFKEEIKASEAYEKELKNLFF